MQPPWQSPTPSLDTATSFTALGIALGLGLLVGMERERVGSRRAGFRTFPLITLLGGVTALLAGPLGPWPVVAGFAGVIAAIVVGNRGAPDPEEPGHPGMTTEIAMLVMFGVGALCVLAPWEIATAVGGVVLVLLHAKDPLHALARRLGDDDVRAIVRFALLALVILPVLPDRTLDPLDVLNPRLLWLVVVLVVGIGLLAYVARRALGARLGAVVGGLLGGLVSSTATTAGVARGVRGGLPVTDAVLVATIASAMVVPRQLIEVLAIAPGALAAVAAPLGLVMAAFVPPLVVAWRRTRRRSTTEVPESTNPAAMGSAILFGLVFSLVLVAVTLAERHFGGRGVLVVAFLSGTHDVDAITISTASLIQDGRLDAATGTRAVVLASVANLLCKTAIAGALGGRAMLRATALAFAAPVVVGTVLVLFAG